MEEYEYHGDQVLENDEKDDNDSHIEHIPCIPTGDKAMDFIRFIEEIARGRRLSY